MQIKIILEKTNPKEMLIYNTSTGLRCGENHISLTVPRVMGIINVTPDSFYAPSRVPNYINSVLEIAGKMISEGASFLDIGGMSSRPGADEISIEDELHRVIPAIEAIHSSFPKAIISVDTYRAEVARAAIKAGATMINDISGGELDTEMQKVVLNNPVSYVLMHLKGKPKDMDLHTDYKDLMGDILKYFIAKVRSFRQAGFSDLVIDPGFGFSKTMEQNYQLISRLDQLELLGCPILIGISRKSTLSKTIGRPVEETLEATTALHMAALMKGARILRVHDVLPAMDAIAVFQQLSLSTKA